MPQFMENLAGGAIPQAQDDDLVLEVVGVGKLVGGRGKPLAVRGEGEHLSAALLPFQPARGLPEFPEHQQPLCATDAEGLAVRRETKAVSSRPQLQTVQLAPGGAVPDTNDLLGVSAAESGIGGDSLA